MYRGPCADEYREDAGPDDVKSTSARVLRYPSDQVVRTCVCLVGSPRKGIATSKSRSHWKERNSFKSIPTFFLGEEVQAASNDK